MHMSDIYSILLVGLNDSDESLAFAQFSLKGHKVAKAKNIVKACEKLKEERFDLAYMKVSAEERALDTVKENIGYFASQPVVLVCSGSTESLVLEVLNAGAFDVVSSPLSLLSLEISMQRVFRHISSQMLQPKMPDHAQFLYHDDTGLEIRAGIIPPKFTIGRRFDNDLVLKPPTISPALEQFISRHHADVLVENDVHVLYDRSKRGTYINGTRVKQAKLKNGDIVQLGSIKGMTLIFQERDLYKSIIGVSDPSHDISFSIRRFKDIGILLAALHKISSVRFLNDLLALIIDTSIDFTGAERGFIMLKEDNEELNIRCARNNHKGFLKGSSFKTSLHVPLEVFKTGRTIVIEDLDLGGDLESHSKTRSFGLRSVYCVPLNYVQVRESVSDSSIGRRITLGVLYLDSQNVGSRLSKTQIEALETLASEAAMAIYNAQLYEIFKKKRLIDEQLAISSEIQRALLPSPKKITPYAQIRCQNLPCYEVGGDYYDYFDLDGGKLGFAVGDVAGKGVPAALLAALTQGIVTSQMLFDTSLPSMISNVNRTLARRGADNRFVTFFFGILDSDGTCRYVNAGHNHPYLIGKDGLKMELTKGGLPLGPFANAQYEAGTVKLRPGDHLVIYTDGVIDALNDKREEFGMKRLETLLQDIAGATTPEILSRLLEAVLSFSANSPQYDDITVMVLGFLESSSEVS